MKKALHLFSLLVLLPTALWAQQASTDKIVISDLISDDYGTYFTVGLEGSLTYTAVNMDITMPEGITIAYYEGELDVDIYASDNTILPYTSKKGVKTWKHSVECSYGVVAPRMLRIACYSGSNAEFTNTSGDLFIIYVEVDNEVYKSSFCPKPIVTVSGIALVEKTDAVKHVPADFTCRPFSSVIAAERTLPLNISAENQIGTLILPFSAALPQGVKAYTCSAIDEEASELVLTPATSLAACTPYIVYAPNGHSGTLSGTVDMTAEYPATDVYSQDFLTGVLSATVVNDGYIMQNQGEGPMFYDAEGSSFSLPAGRCYFTPTGAAASKAYALRIGATSIAPSTLNTQPSATIYDLTGRRVVPPTRGIYIYNGKKMIVE